MKIYIGADHRGYKLKEELKKWLIESDRRVIDCGNDHYDVSDDFPDFSLSVAESVAGKTDSAENLPTLKNPKNLGIVVCGSGVGVNIVANKVRGVRASTAINVNEVALAREHDNINVLSISADFTSFSEAKKLIEVFLSTDFIPEERFVRRLKKIENIERK